MNYRSVQGILVRLLVLGLALGSSSIIRAQAVSGDLTGTIYDLSGAAIPSATVVAANESIRFDIRQSFLCGQEAANVGVIRITFAGGSAIEVDGVYTYRRSGDDRIAALRAFWEVDAVRSVG